MDNPLLEDLDPQQPRKSGFAGQRGKQTDNFLLTSLNAQQQEAVIFTDGPILILAGAGSGKTRVLIYKIAYLIAAKIAKPEEILALTFTNKAAGEMKERIRKLLTTNDPATGEARQGRQRLATTLPLAGTFHSFCAKILRREGKHLGLSPHFVIYDESDQKEVVKEAMKNLDLSTKNFNPSTVLATISQAKNEMITALEYPQYARGYFQETVTRVWLEYQRLLKDHEALDFDDLLLEAVKLFQKNPEVLSRYQNQFHYILIDEYQDTNRVQYALGKLLTGRWRNICVVGDASQSIYSWRGADFRNLMFFQNDFSDLKIFNLEQNYRSTQTILDAAYQVILHNTSHPILKLWTKNHRGEKIQLYEARHEHDEAEFVVQEITSHALSATGHTLHHFAVLYRTNAQSRVLEEAFLHAGLPYVLVGGVRFYDRREIKDVLAYLRLLANPRDMVSHKRIGKIGKNRLAKFLNFTKEFDDLGSQTKLSTLEILDRVLSATGYFELYNPEVKEDLVRLENIKELRSVAMEFPDLTNFLENVALVEQEHLPASQASYPDHPSAGSPRPEFGTKAGQAPKQAGEAKNAVALMTLHAAKGLEFPVVFLVGLEEGLFPHAKSLLDPQELEEERRLCYVGMTRAKEKLYLTYARKRLFFGNRTSNLISRFIADIPEHLLSFNTEV